MRDTGISSCVFGGGTLTPYALVAPQIQAVTLADGRQFASANLQSAHGLPFPQQGSPTTTWSAMTSARVIAKVRTRMLQTWR